MVKRLLALILFAAPALGGTTFTISRTDLATMAGLWETDSVAISGLANSQYPTYSSNWQYSFSNTSVSADQDLHIDMAVDAIGTGASGNNIGASPIIAEIINCTAAQKNYIVSQNAVRDTFQGIFRLYTEHANERHFELHPVTLFKKWNGSSFANDTDYRTTNINAVIDGAQHATSTLTALLNGSQTITVTASADNLSVTISFPSPSVNYVEYSGQVAAAVTSDSLSSYFTFHPSLVPAATVKCRLISGTGAVAIAGGLVANQNGVTVNALTRTDMASVKATADGLSANQSTTVARPIELIVLAVSTSGPPDIPMLFRGGIFSGNVSLGTYNCGKFVGLGPG